MNKIHEFNELYATKEECYVEINGKVHRGFYELNLDDRTAHLYFDERLIASKKMWRAGMFGFEQTVEVEGEEVHCVLDGYQFDIAIHGRYIKNMQTYIPVKTAHMLLFSLIPTIIALIIIGAMGGKLALMIPFVFLCLCALPYAKYEKIAKEEQQLYEDTGYENATKR